MTSRTRRSEVSDTRIPPAGRPTAAPEPQHQEPRSSPRDEAPAGPHPTPVPGASLASLPPAISISPWDLPQEAGGSLSGTDWSSLHDGKKLSESLLVLRPQNGRGKAERRCSRREARSAPARSRGRQAEDFAREPTVFAPPPRGVFVPLTVGVVGAPAPGDMPVRFKVRPWSLDPSLLGGVFAERVRGAGASLAFCAALLGPAKPASPRTCLPPS